MKVYQLYQSVKSDVVGSFAQGPPSFLSIFFHPSLPLSACVCVYNGRGFKGEAGMTGKHQVTGNQPVHQPVIGLGNDHVQTNSVGPNRVKSSRLLCLYSRHRSCSTQTQNGYGACIVCILIQDQENVQFTDTQNIPLFLLCCVKEERQNALQGGNICVL